MDNNEEKYISNIEAADPEKVLEEKRKKKEAKRKRNIKVTVVSIASLILVVVMAIVGENYLTGEYVKEEKIFGENLEEEQENKIQVFCVGLPVFKEKIKVTNENVMKFYRSEAEVTAKEIIEKRQNLGRMDIGLPMKIDFKVENIPDGYEVVSAKIEIYEAEYPDRKITAELNSDFYAEIYHLKTGTEYIYDIIFFFKNGEEVSFNGKFETEEGPRFLDIEGIRNVRDFGGWRTEDGKTIGQGLLYRGTELDGAVREDYKISAKGIKDMVDILEIKTDMDLRWEGDIYVYESVLGKEINYKVYNAPSYLYIYEDYAAELVKEIFSDLAKEENYPIYMHCTHGADRTGTMCFLLGALLGMNEDDLIKEYELSAFMYSDFTRETIAETIEILKTYEGENLSKRTESYLLSVGVAKEEIDAIKTIFLNK